MPKEIAHFALARKTADALPKGLIFSNAVDRFFNLFVLGAVAPDIYFYYLAGPDKDRIQGLSKPFHRSDKKALLPVLSFLENREGQTGEDLPALALAAGVICHIMSDTRFHPLVYYYAGMDRIHKGATARHRQFETALDIWFWHQDPWEHRVRRLVSSVETGRAELIRLLSCLSSAGGSGG